jgi:hypothetical protein
VKPWLFESLNQNLSKTPQHTLRHTRAIRIVIAISRADVILVTFNDDSSARKTRGSTSGRLRLKQPAMHGSTP